MRFLTILAAYIFFISFAFAKPWVPAPETDITGYEVSYGIASGKHSITVDVGTDFRNLLPKLTPGIKYYLVLVAYNKDGMRSMPSAEISYTMPEAVKPQKPTGVKVENK